MEIKTKLNVDDECYFFWDNRIIKSVVKKIEITVVPHKLNDFAVNVFYIIKYLNSDITQHERETFATITETMEFLEKNIYEIH